MISNTMQSEIQEYETFDDMNLPDDLLRGIYSFGFDKPSAIQKKGIVPIQQGRDVLAQAQSGTGKTGTFVIGSLSRIDPKLKEVQVLILCPTHELAKQIYDVASNLGKKMGVHAYYAVGGGKARPVRDDIEQIKKGVQVLIGTPGRIYDLCNRNALKRDHIINLIMDEADEMLKDKFQEQVMEILKMGFPKQTRLCLFSATMAPEIVKFTDELLQDPVRILMAQKQVPLEGITQFYVPLQEESWKFEVLCDIYSQLKINQTIIYCNRQERANWLAMKMKDAKFTLECFHGKMSFEERQQKMEDFRAGSCRVLITTDVLARGIDVQQVSTVVNFDIPSDKASYIHRIGRCGRFGRKGLTINLVGPYEERLKTDIEEYWNTNWKMLPQDLKDVSI